MISLNLLMALFALLFMCYRHSNTFSRRVSMIRSSTNTKIAGITLVAALSFAIAPPVMAQAGDIGQVESFIRSIIQLIAGLAGLIATGFFVAGGFTYITSSGNPEQLDKAKRTITWSAIGLAIVIAAFVISNIVTTLATQSFGS